MVKVAHKACHGGCWRLCVHFWGWTGLGQAEAKQERVRMRAVQKASNSESEHFRKRALPKASTSESEHFRKRALQKTSTSESEHFRKRALPKASTSENEHFRKRALQKASTSEGEDSESEQTIHMLHIFQRASNSESSCNNIASEGADAKCASTCMMHVRAARRNTLHG